MPIRRGDRGNVCFNARGGEELCLDWSQFLFSFLSSRALYPIPGARRARPQAAHGYRSAGGPTPPAPIGGDECGGLDLASQHYNLRGHSCRSLYGTGSHRSQHTGLRLQSNHEQSGQRTVSKPYTCTYRSTAVIDIDVSFDICLARCNLARPS